MASLMVCLALSCSHFGSIGAGPAMARPSGIEKSYGSELRLRHGAGSSDGQAITLFEVEGRAAVSERASAISVGLGPGYLYWLGPLALSGHVTPALGAQYFARTPFASAGVHGGLSLGFVLQTSEQPWTFGPWPAAMPEPSSITIVRERTLVTLELSGAVDAHARGATLSTGLLLGIAWSDEKLSKQRHELPPGLLR